MGTRLEIKKMAASLWGKMTLNCDISRTSWHMMVSDGSFFWIFHALSFEPNLCEPGIPLQVIFHHCQLKDKSMPHRTGPSTTSAYVLIWTVSFTFPTQSGKQVSILAEVFLLLSELCRNCHRDNVETVVGNDPTTKIVRNGQL